MVRTNTGGTTIQKLSATCMGMPTLAEGDKVSPAQERTFRCLHLLSGLVGRKLKSQKRYEAEVPISAGSAENGRMPRRAPF